MSSEQNGVPSAVSMTSIVADQEARVRAMQQRANVEVARFVSSTKDTRWATMLLVLVSLPNGRVRSLYGPFSEAEQTAAAEADVLRRNQSAICTAVQFLARGRSAMLRQIINYLAEALGLTPAGNLPFLGLGNEPRPRGGSSSKEWGPCWPADLPAAVEAMANRLNTFVEAHLNEDA